MVFRFDGTGIDSEQKSNGITIKKGWYEFAVIEFSSQKGDRYPKEGFTKNKFPKVDCLCEIQGGEYKGQRVFHTVTFLPKGQKGDGMAIHWLKTIRQPWEGEFQVNADAWIGEKFQGYVVQDEYNGSIKNKIAKVKAVAETSDVPF